MMWDDLTDSQKNALVQQMLVGLPKSAENTNRAKCALADFPDLVEKLFKEMESDAGIKKVVEDTADDGGGETHEDESGFDLGLQKDVEGELG